VPLSAHGPNPTNKKITFACDVDEANHKTLHSYASAPFHVFDLNSSLFHAPSQGFAPEISEAMEHYILHADVPNHDNIDFSQFDFPPLRDATDTQDMVPSSLLIAKSVQDQPLSSPLRILFDTGSNISLLNTACLPLGTVPDSSSTPQQGITAAGP